MQPFISVSVRRRAVDLLALRVDAVHRRREPGGQLLVRQRLRLRVRVVLLIFGLGLGRPLDGRRLEAPFDGLSRPREASQLFYGENRRSFRAVARDDLASC